VERNGDQLLTVPEVAGYLRIGPESTRRWLREGKLRGINLGRGSGWRIRRADLEVFIAQRDTSPTRHDVVKQATQSNGRHGIVNFVAVGVPAKVKTE
jgi:excisionase family DNA binding protein